MNDRMKESLSALVDAQADELEIRRLLNNAEHSPEIYEHWQRYLLIGDVLREESIAAFDVDIAQGIRQALDGEPMDELSAPKMVQPDKDTSDWMRWLSLGSSAAAITLAVFMGISLYQQEDALNVQNVAALQSNTSVQPSISTVSRNRNVQPVANLSDVMVNQELKEAQTLLNEYLMQHVEDNAMNSMSGIAPLARTASFREP